MRRSATAKTSWTSIARAMTLAAVLAASLAVPASAGAATFTVTTTDDEVGGSTCPEGDPDCSLREAVQRANASFFEDDTIIVPADTYVLSLAGAGEDQAATGDIDIEKQISSLAIVGAGAATTTIDANDLDRVFHVLDGANATISGLTIRDGTGNGAGVLSADDTGTSAPTATAITDSVLVSNVSGGGGAIVNEGASSMTVTGSTINGNTGGLGGGILNQNQATMTVSGSAITGNTSSFIGGGILNQNQAAMSITGSAITGNSSSGLGGGGVFNQNQAQLTIDTSTISGNSTSGNLGGGAVFNQNQATLTMTRGTISSNQADADGGALFGQNEAVFRATNTTISGNVAGNRGGAAYGKNQPTIELRNSTVARNSAGAAGGGFFDDTTPPDPTPSFFIFAGTIVPENTVAGASQNCVINHPGVFASQGHNLEDADTCGFGSAPGDILNGNPALGPLADNGGPTQTHALEAGSAAIDAGPSDCPPPETDQRGVERPQGPACDIGAFETAAGELPVTPPAAGPCSNVIPGSKKSEKLTGTDGSDLIRGRRGNDRIRGGGGGDCLRGGRGRDRIRGGEGDDQIHVRRGRRDVVRCGPGKDTVKIGKKDRVRGCEKVKT